MSKNALDYDAIVTNGGDANNDIPKEITIFASDIIDFSSELSINTSQAENVEIHKLSRYIFPHEDAGPTIAGQTEIPDLRSLEYAVNLACHRLDDELKEHWDNLCNRDVSYPEVSKNGIMATRYDLKNQITLYNKSKEKERYVDSLANNLDLDILATESYTTNTPDSFSGQGDNVDYFPGSSAKSFSKISPRTKQNSPLFVHPTSGPLVTFIKQCEDADKTLVEGLNNLIHERKHQAKKTFLLQILSHVKTGFVYKKGRKKVDKFSGPETL